MGEKNILIAVNKEHLDNILDGVKKIEWRKKPLPLGLAYGYETKNKGGFNLSQVFERYPLALELHIADLRASYLVETRK